MAGNGPINITFQEEGLSEIRKRLGDLEKRAPSVMANALNATQTRVKGFLIKRVSEKYSYDKKIKIPKQRIKRASQKNLTAIMYHDRKDPGIEHFNFNPGSPGSPLNSPGERLAARVRSDGGFKNITRAFMAKDKVFQRDGSKRLPISRMFGPSEHSMVNSVWNEPDTQRFTSEMLAEKLDDQINVQFLKKWGMSTKEAKSYLTGK